PQIRAPPHFADNLPCRVGYTLSLHDALPISQIAPDRQPQRLLQHRLQEARLPIGAERDQGHPRRLLIHEDVDAPPIIVRDRILRSEEHTSELQSRENLVCRLLLEKKKNVKKT